MNGFYRGFETVLVALHPLWKLIGYQRLERPVAEDLQAEAAAEAARIEARFSDEDLEKMIRAKGLAPDAPAAGS